MADAASGLLLAALEGPSLTSGEEDFFRRESPAGITVFRRNFPADIRVSQENLKKFQSLRESGQPPFMVAIDQEGGRVSRLKEHIIDLGPAMNLEKGASDPGSLAGISAYAKTLSEALLAIGVNTNFAPVVDILTEPSNTAIGDRAFGTDLSSVLKRAASFLSGQTAGGVVGCLKHFPGQGNANADTHYNQAIIDLPKDLLMQRELAAFAPMLKQVPMVMISHCIYPALSKKLASLSPEIIQDLLQKQMGFRGIVVSDDMIMAAISQDEKQWQEQIVESVAAGTDLVLVCKHLDRAKLALECIRRQMAKSSTFSARVKNAAEKVLALRRQHFS